MERDNSARGLFRGNVLNLAVTIGVYAFAEQMVLPYLSLYILALGGNAETIGFVNSVGTIGSILLLPVGGYITDYRGRVKLAIAMSYVYALSSLFFVFATDWRSIAVGIFFQRMSLIYGPALAALQADSLPPRQRGLGFGLFRAIPGLASLTSPFIAGYLVTVYGTSYAMRICYSIFLLSGVVASTIRLKLKETLEESRPHIPLLHFPRLLIASYREMLKSLSGVPQAMWIITIISVAITFFTSMAGPFWVVYATGVIGLSALEWGIVMLAATSLRTIMSLPAGTMIDRVGKKRCIVISLALMPIPVLCFIYSRTFLEVVGVVLFIEILDDFLMPSVQALVADLIPRNRRGLINSALGRGYLIVTVGGVQGGGALALFLPSMLGFLVGGMTYGLDRMFPWFVLAPALAICAFLAGKFVREPDVPQK